MGEAEITERYELRYLHTHYSLRNITIPLNIILSSPPCNISNIIYFYLSYPITIINHFRKEVQYAEKMGDKIINSFKTMFKI